MTKKSHAWIGPRSLCEALERRCLLSAGDLDLTFSDDGKVRYNFASGTDTASDVAVQSNGKIVMVGQIGTRFAVARLNPDGSPDTTFGPSGTGVVTTFINGSDVCHARAVAIQSDGKIVVVGETEGGLFGNVAVVRYTINGAPDPLFSGDGKLTSGLATDARDVTIQKDGKIVVVGAEAGLVSDWDFSVVRFNANGTLDNSFGTLVGLGPLRSGRRLLGFGGTDLPESVAIDYNGTAATNLRYGTIVVAGRVDPSDAGPLDFSLPTDIGVARVKANGDVDTSFSGDGKANLHLPSSTVFGYALVIQPGGKVVVGGTWYPDGPAPVGNFILARFTATGALDKTFGGSNSGYAVVDMFGDDDGLDLVSTFGGKLVLGGKATGDFAFAVFSSNGIFQQQLGNVGRFSTDFGGTESIEALAVAPGNKLVAVGTAVSSGVSRFAVARYLDFGPDVAIISTDPNASEPGTNVARFTVSRSQSLPVSTRVYYTVGGSAAAPGSVSTVLTDYTGIPSIPSLRYVDIPANQGSATVTITPKDDTRVEGTETVIITLSGNNAYSITSPSVTLSIADNDVAAGFSAHVNFQPALSALYAAYVPDTGAVFGSRNGLSYGWDADNSANARDRNNPASGDQRYDTLNHMQLSGANRKWEIGVPNGTYSVHVLAGNPSFFDSVYKINAEGVLAVNGTPASGSRWVEGTVTVTVSDGRVTLSNATGSVNNRIDFVDIVQLAPVSGAAFAAISMPNATQASASMTRFGASAILEELDAANRGARSRDAIRST